MSTESEELKALSFVRRALLRKNERLRELNRKVVTLQEENEKLKWKCQDQEKEITRLNSELGLANDALQTERFDADDDPSATALGDDFSNTEDTSNQQNERLGIGVDGGHQNIDFSDPSVNIKKELAEAGQHEPIADDPDHDPSYIGAEEYELSEKAFGAGAAGPGGSSDPGGGADQTNYDASVENFAVPAGADIDPAALLAGDLAAVASGAGPLQNIPSGRAARNRISTSQAAGSGGSPQGTAGHLKRHCPVCGRLFSSRKDLVRHVRVHTGERPYPCPCCDYRAVTAQDRKKHVVRVHPDYQMCACPRPSCQKFFVCVEEAAATVPPDRQCPVCGRPSASRKDLVRHLRTHTGERPYACPECDYRASVPQTRKRHVIHCHPGYPLVVCPRASCARSFVFADEMEAHVARCSLP